MVLVSFLDDPGRKTVEYTFTRKDDSRMFLSGVHLWEYPDDQPGRRLSEASRREEIRYHEDGYVHRTIIDKNEGYRETVEYNSVPVDTNWEPVPAFGDYASIGRFERGRSPLDSASPTPRPGS